MACAQESASALFFDNFSFLRGLKRLYSEARASALPNRTRASATSKKLTRDNEVQQPRAEMYEEVFP